MSRTHRYFYKTLREIFAGHTVLAKVRLADLVEADGRHPNWQAKFNRVKSKQIDFVICDEWLCPLVAVALDGSSPDALVDQILKEAALEIVHVPRQKQFFPKDIRQLLWPKLNSSQLL